MRVLYDGQMYTTQHAGGVNRWFQRLIEGLPPQWEPILTTAERRDLHFPKHPKLRVFHWQRYGFRPGRVSYWMEKYYFRAVTRRCRADIAHPTYYNLLTRLPLASLPCPAVVTVYDMIHEIFRDSMDPDGHMAAIKREAVLSARAVICISGRTKQDLLERIPVPPERVSVIHLAPGIDGKSFAELPLAPGRPYFLHVGSRAAGYKNFDRLLRAFSRLASRDPEPILAVVGKPFNHQEKGWLSDLRLEGRIVHLGFVDDPQLATLYRDALAFVYPSLYEGFGIPPLEAMACGGVVVAARAGSIPEVVGTAALLFEPSSDEALEEALRRVGRDTALRDGLRERGRERVAMFSWEATVRETMALYERVVREASA